MSAIFCESKKIVHSKKSIKNVNKINKYGASSLISIRPNEQIFKNFLITWRVVVGLEAILAVYTVSADPASEIWP